MKHSKLFIAFCTLVLLLATLFSPYIAEATDLASFKSAQELFDIVSYAAYHTAEAQVESTSGGVVNNAFLTAFLQAAAGYRNETTLLNDKEVQTKFLTETLQEKVEFSLGDSKEFDGYFGLKAMTSKKLENGNFLILGTVYSAKNAFSKLSSKDILEVKWLDQRLLLELKKDSKSLYGYKLVDFSLHGELQMEEELHAYFESHLVDYVNSRMGFALQYPSVFSEKSIKESAEGIQASTAKKTAVMEVKTFSNTQSWTAEQYYTNMQATKPEANLMLDKENAKVSIYEVLDENTLKFELSYFTEDNVYQVNYTFQKELAEDFGLYIQYLHNTFQVLGTEIG